MNLQKAVQTSELLLKRARKAEVQYAVAEVNIAQMSSAKCNKSKQEHQHRASRSKLSLK